MKMLNIGSHIGDKGEIDSQDLCCYLYVIIDFWILEAEMRIKVF
jgi:hypothetical protein